MSILGVLSRFTIIYIGLIIIVGLILTYVDVGNNSGVNIGILASTIFWVCTSFAKKNGRYFDKAEKTRVVAGFIIINIIIQSVAGVAALVGSGQEVSGSTLLPLVGLIGALHAVAIYLFVSVVGRSLLRKGIISG